MKSRFSTDPSAGGVFVNVVQGLSTVFSAGINMEMLKTVDEPPYFSFRSSSRRLRSSSWSVVRWLAMVLQACITVV